MESLDGFKFFSAAMASNGVPLNGLHRTVTLQNSEPETVEIIFGHEFCMPVNTSGHFLGGGYLIRECKVGWFF